MRAINVYYYPAVRTGSSNTHFFFIITPPSGRGLVIPVFFSWFFFFFGGHLPQTSGFRSAKQILLVSFATQARAFILSDRSIFYTPGGGEQRRVQCPWGFSCFLFFFLVTCPRLPVFARPDKSSPCLSLDGLGIVS